MEESVGFKEAVESSPTLVIIGSMIIAFGAGIGTIEFLNSREEKLRSSILQQLQSENKELKDSQAKLLDETKKLLTNYIDQQIQLKQINGKISNNEANDLKNKVPDALNSIQLREVQKEGLLGGPNSFFRKNLGIKF